MTTTHGFVEILERRAMLAHVGLDLGFGDAGYARVSGSLLIAPVNGGKVLAVGADGAVRLNPDGSVDDTFRDRGAITTVARTPVSAIVAGRKLFVAGFNIDQDNNIPSLYIRKANVGTGSTDSTFGTDGAISFEPLPAVAGLPLRDFTVTGMATTPDGGLVVAIKEGLQSGLMYGTNALVLEKFNNYGEVDTNFGRNGVVAVNVLDEYQYAGSGRIVVDGNANIVVIGGNEDEPTLARFRWDGSVDTAFGTNGIVTLNGFYAYGHNLLLQPDDKLLVHYFTSDITGERLTGHIERYTTDGALDDSFGDGGSVTLASFGNITLDAAGVVVGYTMDGELFRLTPIGTIDTAFDDNNYGFSPVPDTLGKDDSPFTPTYLAFDASGGLLLGRSSEVTRFVERDRVALASDGRLYVDGTDGADTISAAASGDSVVVTLNGRNWTFAADAITSFVITAANGSDVIDISVDRDALVNADDGDDSIRTAGGADMINCSNGADTVDSGGGKDLIFGGDGNDSIYSSAGDDLVFGEYGDDSIAGGDGNDKLYGGLSYVVPNDEYSDDYDGDDSISGNAGNDRCDGQFGNDRVAGNGGRDRLFGGVGEDRLYGGASSDWLYGEADADQLFGEGGADRLYDDDGYYGIDTLHGNAGDDMLFSRDNLIDQLFGDGGTDSASADEGDVLTSIEVVLA